MPDPTDPRQPCPPEPPMSSPDLVCAASAAVTALSKLARFPSAADAAERALAALSELGPVVGRPSAGDGAVGRELVGNVDMSGGQVAIGVENGPDSLNGSSQVISSDEASKCLGDGVSNQQEHTAWCEICRVGCNSFKILEHHKNGKRHKKNLQRIEELKKIVHVSANMQDQGNSGVGDVVEGEAAGKIPDDFDRDPRLENNRPTVQEPSEQRNSPCKKRESIGSGAIAKRVKNMVDPVVCSICNIKCDTSEVFNKHLSGKKHISKVKRSQVRQPGNREIGLRAVYLNYPTSQVPPSQGSEYQFLIPGGSYLPPMPQAYMPLPPQVHGRTEGNNLVGPFQRPRPQAPDGSVSLNSRPGV
ncbi:hypothetical protein MLD38_020888 [Melastoma candidum]|uniref:Uncharacterized protein n=1 Tax=Melastoma candidum TaxID=119954 RepID=A0ACB9QEV9_9MYRT|nr:hypothetical protein MLD38_020888 [Melastoma candidum]